MLEDDSFLIEIWQTELYNSYSPCSEGTGKALQIPGCVQSRINISNDGWKHVVDRHFSSKNASQFTISQDELKSLLQNKDIVKTPVTRTLESADGIQYVREIDVGKNIGLDKFNIM